MNSPGTIPTVALPRYGSSVKPNYPSTLLHPHPLVNLWECRFGVQIPILWAHVSPRNLYPGHPCVQENWQWLQEKLVPLLLRGMTTYCSVLSSVTLSLSKTLQLLQACNVCLCKPAGQEAVVSLLLDAPKLYPQSLKWGPWLMFLFCCD